MLIFEGGKMGRPHKKSRRHPHRKHRMKFWEAIRKIGFKRALSYEIRHPRHYPWYPIWFYPMLISMVIIAIILYYYPIDYAPYLFYILEIIIVGYMMYRLLKRFDRIKIRGSILKLWGLKILSGLVSAIGLVILYFVLISFFLTPFEILLNQESLITQMVTFGYQFNIPFIIPLLLSIIGIGMCAIGAYLLFKFKITSGNIIWVGRI